ncbi:hypothetical protein VT84_13790 [Gemmata sp. SH-PL17]|uniref:hypothetical protein n=1 Tax=Gemmata sp. SH-PL17 TaxID=1630693 RepID=UPI00078EC325|nr:hypothetical protein [Gemmata sp. SH-PL17]AMV25465.1 hypothetical protein VT84_13790 [Gemmata sp. SH-PL17]
MDGGVLQERARSVVRWAKLVLVHEAHPDDVRTSLALLRGTFTAIAQNTGDLPMDGNGRLWEERLLTLAGMIRDAGKRRAALRKALNVVLSDMEPLAGVESHEECPV